MKRKLRHPIRSITEPYGKAGLMVAILALVLATTGAAFAAVGLNSKQKKEVTAIAKKFAGKPGAPGANGTNGTNGAPGEKGPKGDPGTAGENGKSVTVTSVTSPGCNGQAGAEVKQEGVGSGVKVCNGTTGFTSTLPSGKTETGVWSIGQLAKKGPSATESLGETLAQVPISFNIPLPSQECEVAPGEFAPMGICESNVHIFEGTTIPAGCTGTIYEGSVNNLGAEPGNLCIWNRTGALGITAASLIAVDPEAAGEHGAGTHGAILIRASTPEARSASGTWAVTAE